MTYLKRFLWLAAWGVWLWLGFGLYRELPRELGPRVRKLWIEGEYTPIGFVADTNNLAILTPPKGSRGFSNVLVVQAETGAFVAEHPLEENSQAFFNFSL